MYFKHPEILYFLFLLIVPVLVHLFQLRRFKKEYFTNVRFLKALSIQTRKSSKLKKWLLLTCRLLLLSCIIIAFAQPFFESKDSENANNELYIILDNSFSMQAKGKKGQLLKRAVQELLEETPENVNFSLLTNSENYWNTDIKLVRSALQNLKYSATPFQLDNIISKIKAHKSAFKKDILIITDAVGLDENQLKNSNATDSPLFIIPKAEQKNNVSIDSVFINKTLDNFYEISVQISAYGDGIKPIPISLYNENKLIAKTIVTLEKKKKNINFTIPKQAFHGYFSIVDNGLSYDNTLYFSISKIKKTNVISIGETTKSNFLSRIYTRQEFNFNNYNLSALDYNTLEEQDAIVLNELDEIPQALATTLKSFVEKGGNLIVIPSAIISITNMNYFVRNFGNLTFNSLENTEKLITTINFNHPIFSSVFENKVTNFQYPKTKKSFAISSPSPAALSYQDQSVFLASIASSVSAVTVFAAPINIENSNFQQSPLIVPTFYKMAMNNQNNGVNALTIGNNNPHMTEASLNNDAILTVKGLEEQFIPIQQILKNKVKMTFNDYPKQAGNFSIYNKKEWIENISFNYNRTESDLAIANQNSLSNYKTIESIKSFFDTLQTDRTDNQIWKWFVIFALIFIITEMLIIRFVK
ncbi:BatA domain-containing protein [Flavobacterium sp. LB2P44]|uniref:BatA domain-containing protein n=1 Tax=Flavobacterium sp. LB2P44 TaxID=3401713 RepID=UPI003AAF9B6C